MASETVEQPRGSAQATQTIELPAPTAWPIILAFGITLVFAGLVTNDSVSILGALFAIAGCIGWFRDVLPHEKHESVPVEENVPTIATSRPRVTRIEWITQELHRARLPLEIYPISAGVKGGMAGSAAMAVLAILYGIVSGRGIWYPITLLSAGLFPDRSTIAPITVFHWDALIIATIIHLVCSVLVGLLYGAALPMFPRRPILLGGVIAPIFWTGLLHGILGLINPLLDARIDWPWFIASQFAFGIVAGLVVARQERLGTRQFEPFLVRAGIEAAGLKEEKPN